MNSIELFKLTIVGKWQQDIANETTSSYREGGTLTLTVLDF